jgi:dTDP-4-amino-4,6-dideoxygalactose transaminase
MREIPYINLKAQHQQIKDEMVSAFTRVLDHANFILGREVEQFEQETAGYCGTKYAVGVNSGTDALFLCLKAYGVGSGDEVITAPNSFLASASVIVAAGARPVFVDVRDDLNIDPDLIKEKISGRTKAIIPVHLTGKPAEMGPIMELAKKHNLKVIEDAAQAIGAEYGSKKTGALGDAGCFSLHPLKTLNACGDGGVITTDDKNLYQILIQLRNIGLKNRNESDLWGYNSRLDTIQAALLSIKLKHLDRWIRERRKNAQFYNEQLTGIVKVPVDVQNGRSAYHTYVIQTEQRNELQEYLQQHGVGTKIHYPIPIHLQKAAQNLGYKAGDYPVSEKQAGRILSLPVYQGLTGADLEYVVSNVRTFFGGKKGY